MIYCYELIHFHREILLYIVKKHQEEIIFSCYLQFESFSFRRVTIKRKTKLHLRFTILMAFTMLFVEFIINLLRIQNI